MDELEQRARRAEEADRLWNSEIMREAREQIEQALMAGFAKTPMRDDEGLRWIRALFEAHKAYAAFFKAALEDGKIASNELEQKKSLRDRIRQVI